MNISDLPGAILGEVLQFVGPGEYRYLAGVSQVFRSVYNSTFKDNRITAEVAVVQSVARLQIWMKETPPCLRKTRIDCIRYPGSNIVKSAAAVGQLEVLMWMKDVAGFYFNYLIYCQAAFHGHVHILEWGQTTWYTTRTCAAAAHGNQQATLEWLRANDCPWAENTCSAAAAGGYLNILQYARSEGCPWNELTCSNAATNGHLLVLKWARENGCPWDAQTCAMAAYGGHLHILQWAKEQGCPWDSLTCAGAAEKGEMAIIQWAIENGCPFDEEECISIALHKGHDDLFEWLACRER